MGNCTLFKQMKLFLLLSTFLFIYLFLLISSLLSLFFALFLSLFFVFIFSVFSNTEQSLGITLTEAHGTYLDSSQASSQSGSRKGEGKACRGGTGLQQTERSAGQGRCDGHQTQR